jgi:hypothetical protein
MTSPISNQCLILTPPGDEFAPVRNFIVGTVSGSENDYPLKPVFKDQTSDWERILPLVEKSSLVVVDITGNDPNVMYELGLAHGLKKQVLVLVQKGEGSVPSDLRGVFFYVYEPGNIAELESVIRHWVYGFARDLHSMAR